jgi:hypothetical protein
MLHKFTTAMYDTIDADTAELKLSILDNISVNKVKLK